MNAGRCHRGRLAALSAILWLTASCFAQPPGGTLVRADYSNAKGVAKFEELERTGNVSRIRIVQDTRSSVGGSLFVAFAFYEVARARGCEYFVSLDEKPDEKGGRIYVVGFTNNPDADIRAEFGSQYRPAQPLGQKKDYPSVSRYAPLFEKMRAAANAAPSPSPSPSPSVSPDPGTGR